MHSYAVLHVCTLANTVNLLCYCVRMRYCSLHKQNGAAAERSLQHGAMEHHEDGASSSSTSTRRVHPKVYYYCCANTARLDR
jgi:hypothetical protein